MDIYQDQRQECRVNPWFEGNTKGKISWTENTDQEQKMVGPPTSFSLIFKASASSRASRTLSIAGIYKT
jgi:hypothetical protein